MRFRAGWLGWMRWGGSTNWRSSRAKYSTSASVWGLRGRKGQALGGQRVAAIAQWPGHIPGGVVVDAPAMAIDLFPTLLALAGLDLPSDRVIDGARSGRWKYYRSVHLCAWPTPLDKKSTLAGRWVHANRYTDPQTGETVARSTHDPPLFDVVVDRDESYNVVWRHPDVAARLHAAIEAWERDFFANPRGWR